MSQSPYGAKWFATGEVIGLEAAARYIGRNPLTGLSGLQPNSVHFFIVRSEFPSRNPLTGLSGLQPERVAGFPVPDIEKSQSPYGAKWFATDKKAALGLSSKSRVAIPLRG